MSFLRVYKNSEVWNSLVVELGKGVEYSRHSSFVPHPGSIVRWQMFEDDLERACTFPIGLVVWTTALNSVMPRSVGILWSSDPDL